MYPFGNWLKIKISKLKIKTQLERLISSAWGHFDLIENIMKFEFPRILFCRIELEVILKKHEISDIKLSWKFWSSVSLKSWFIAEVPLAYYQPITVDCGWF